MKYFKLFAFAIILTAVISCKSNIETDKAGTEIQNEETVANKLQAGDLVFVALPLDYDLNASSDMISAIMASTSDTSELNYIHVAIADVDDDNNVWIIDATLKHGVDRYPLDTFLCDFTLPNGKYPIFDIMRLEDNSKAKEYIENAKKYVGREYDKYFLPDNDEQYCSELVRNSYRNGEDYIFSDYPMNFKSLNGTFPVYWQELFEYIGQPIPQGVSGTNPNAMYKEKCLNSIDIKLESYAKKQ